MKMTFEELESEFEKRVRKLNPTNIFDMAEINQKSAEILGEIVSENVFNFYNVEAVCKGILRRYYDKVNKTNSDLQKKYDEKHGLQIAPQKADFPTERVTQIAESLTDKTVPPETIQRRARNAIENVANSFHDDYVRKNAEFRSRAGIKCYIVRETNGKCCEWCSSLAGRYVCSDAPDDIFRRHDNCTCTVTFENGRERQNVWSKKKWQVSSVLEVPYQPFVPEKSQAENLQKNQLAKYIGLDKSVTDIKQTEMRDFIKQTKQNRDYFREQNYLKKKLFTDSVKSDKKYVDKYFWDGIIKKNRKNTLSVSVSDSIPEAVTNKVNSAINKIAKKFPIIKEQVSNIKYGELDNAYGLCSFNTGNSINEITLLKSLFSDEDTLIKILHHDFKTKKSYETDNIESLVAHELGHALHSILALKRTGLKYGKSMNSFEAIAFGNERNKIIQDIYCLYFTDEDYEEILDECERQLGIMARNPNEMIAQAFGNYYYGSKKQPLSEVIVKYFIKELK